jgi:hypothetical protein
MNPTYPSSNPVVTTYSTGKDEPNWGGDAFRPIITEKADQIYISDSVPASQETVEEVEQKLPFEGVPLYRKSEPKTLAQINQALRADRQARLKLQPAKRMTKRERQRKTAREAVENGN